MNAPAVIQTEVLEIHPAAALFPMMDAVRLQELADDIAVNGLRVPVQILDGHVIDGRNRIRACEIAGVAPHFEHAPAGANPWQLAWALNGQRRDLNDAQRYLLWAECAKGDEAWQAEQKRIRDDANRARADAAKERERREDGTLAPKAASAATKCGATGSPAPKPKEEPAPKAAERKAEAAGVTRKTVEMADALASKRPDLAEKVKAGEVSLSSAYTAAKKEEKVAKLTDIAAQEVKASQGVYDVIVLDPPWQMEKIEREVAPNQAGFDYPTMNESQLAELEIPTAEDCHVWVWTTHKHLPMALRLLEAWGLKYVCTFVWHKPGGFQPFGLPQYNCEFAIYARKGTPQFIDLKAFPTCFNAPRGAHSEKPQEFYDIVHRVTAGRRLDMFNRRRIKGFDGWGNEAPE